MSRPAELVLERGALCPCGCENPAWIARCSACGEELAIEPCVELYAYTLAQDWLRLHRC